MAKFAPWADFFKFSTEVLEDDYIYDKNFQIKGKTKTGDSETSFKVEQSRPDHDESTNSFEFKHKYADSDYTCDNKLTSGGKISNANELNLGSFNDQFKGWSYILTFNMVSGSTYDKISTSSAIKLKQPTLEGKITFDHSKKGDFDYEGTYKPLQDKEWFVGGTGTIKTREAKIGKFALGFANKCSDSLSTGWQWRCEENDKYGKIKLYTLRTASDTLKLAANIDYSIDAKKLDTTVGFQHSCSGGKVLKGKISTSGQAALSAKYDLGSGLNVIFSTGFDLATKGALYGTPHPFAVGIDYKF